MSIMWVWSSCVHADSWRGRDEVGGEDDLCECDGDCGKMWAHLDFGGWGGTDEDEGDKWGGEVLWVWVIFKMYRHSLQTTYLLHKHNIIYEPRPSHPHPSPFCFLRLGPGNDPHRVGDNHSGGQIHPTQHLHLQVFSPHHDQIILRTAPRHLGHCSYQQPKNEQQIGFSVQIQYQLSAKTLHPRSHGITIYPTS